MHADCSGRRGIHTSTNRTSILLLMTTWCSWTFNETEPNLQNEAYWQPNYTELGSLTSTGTTKTGSRFLFGRVPNILLLHYFLLCTGK